MKWCTLSTGFRKSCLIKSMPSSGKAPLHRRIPALDRAKGAMHVEKKRNLVSGLPGVLEPGTWNFGLRTEHHCFNLVSSCGLCWTIWGPCWAYVWPHVGPYGGFGRSMLGQIFPYLWGKKGFGAPQIWCLTVLMLGLLGHDFGNPDHFGHPNASKCPYIYIYIKYQDI